MIVAAKTWQRSAPLPLVHGLHDPAALPRLHPWLAPEKKKTWKSVIYPFFLLFNTS